jgi:hypothetical protein
MPLDKRCSTEAFSNNVRAEYESGKEQKQAVAIAYSVLCKACGCPRDARMTPKQMAAYAKESNMSKSEPNWEAYGMRDPAFSYKSWRLEGTPRTAKDFDREAQLMKKKGYGYKIKVKLPDRVDYLYAKTASLARELNMEYPGSVIMPMDAPHEDYSATPGFHDPDWALDPKQLDEKCGKKNSGKVSHTRWQGKSFLVKKRLGEAISSHFVVYIKWPDKFGTYGASKTTNEEMDRYVDKLLGATVEAFNKNEVSLEIGPSIPGRDRRGNPVLQVNIYFRESPIVGRVPVDWSTKFVNSLKRVRGVLSIR